MPARRAAGGIRTAANSHRLEHGLTRAGSRARVDNDIIGDLWPLPSASSPSYLLTSESVTEGHPDKICDQVSDAVLDGMLAQDRDARVACETAITKGLCVVIGEVTTHAELDIQRIIRDTIRGIGYNAEAYRLRRRPRADPGLSEGAVTGHRGRRRPLAGGATGLARGRPVRAAGGRRPGHDDRLRVQRDAGADAADDLACAPAGAAAREGAQGRHASVPAARRQDAGHGRVRARPAEADRGGGRVDAPHARRDPEGDRRGRRRRGHRPCVEGLHPRRAAPRSWSTRAACSSSAGPPPTPA